MREDLRDSSRNGGKVEVEFEEYKKRNLECAEFREAPVEAISLSDKGGLRPLERERSCP
jgi:hypothetical protein